MQIYAKNQQFFLPKEDIPSLSYLPSIFKRRLSVLTKITIEVVHRLIENTPDFDVDIPLCFTSFLGEVNQEKKVNSMLYQEGSISPASFSLSVFNTPIAQTAMAFSLTGGYSSCYPCIQDCNNIKDAFEKCIEIAKSAILCRDNEELVFVFADEKLCPEYENLFKKEQLLKNQSFAVSCILTCKKEANAMKIEDFSSLVAKNY